jgi:hypothetical protein
MMGFVTVPGDCWNAFENGAATGSHCGNGDVKLKELLLLEGNMSIIETEARKWKR